MRIRGYQDRDQDAVVALWRARELLINPLNDPVKDINFCRDSGHGEVLVGEQDGELVATAMVGHDGHRGWIYYVAVGLEQQGAGFGRAITLAAEQWLRDRGVAKVELLVRDTNTRVIGFYQRCGYAVEPRAVLSKRLDGIALDLAQQRDDEPVVITYLAMRKKPTLPRIEPKIKSHLLLKSHEPTVSFYRYIYDAVGRPWYWTDRKRLSDAELEAIIRHDMVDIFVLYANGAPAGFFELNRREMPDIDLAYFGVTPEFVGAGLGAYMLVQALEEAWAHEPLVVTVNTCTLDHPKALSLYQRFGFVPYDRKEVPTPWQRGDNVVDLY